jgi:hypothetical protein
MHEDTEGMAKNRNKLSLLVNELLILQNIIFQNISLIIKYELRIRN